MGVYMVAVTAAWRSLTSKKKAREETACVIHRDWGSRDSIYVSPCDFSIYTYIHIHITHLCFASSSSSYSILSFFI